MAALVGSHIGAAGARCAGAVTTTDQRHRTSLRSGLVLPTWLKLVRSARGTMVLERTRGDPAARPNAGEGRGTAGWISAALLARPNAERRPIFRSGCIPCAADTALGVAVKPP